jgi:hypothetical protein
MGIEDEDTPPRTNPAGEPPAFFHEIQVKGCMDEFFWADWFGGIDFNIDLHQGETTLRGSVSDQAELYGLLSQLRNKGLILISVQQVNNET